MRTSTAILSALFVLVAYLSGSYAQEGLFNVTSPEPNSPYTAGQILPLIYEIPSTTTENNLQLSISLVSPSNATFYVNMVANADVSHGFSNQKDLGNNITVFEHQANYNIPTDTTAGSYQVIFTNTLTGYNTTVPITIAPVGTTPNPAKPTSSGSDNGKSMWDTGAATSNAPVWFTVLAAVGVALSM